MEVLTLSHETLKSIHYFGVRKKSPRKKAPREGSGVGLVLGWEKG